MRVCSPSRGAELRSLDRNTVLDALALPPSEAWRSVLELATCVVIGGLYGRRWMFDD